MQQLYVADELNFIASYIYKPFINTVCELMFLRFIDKVLHDLHSSTLMMYIY